MRCTRFGHKGNFDILKCNFDLLYGNDDVLYGNIDLSDLYLEKKNLTKFL